jgi:ubiquinone/menaquinone biosynthesis C-methylase UbiE
VRLFKLSLLKQEKFRALCDLLGPTEGLTCLDIGGDNGVISLLLRQCGGTWTSADGSAAAVSAITQLVSDRVCQVEGAHLPLPAGHFDRVVVIDYLEHVMADATFIAECHRVLKPDGVLIVNTPHVKRSLLFGLRRLLGLSDARHGHVRPGYTERQLFDVLKDGFDVEQVRTYSRFFIQLLDTAIRFVSERKGASHDAVKGTLLTADDFKRMEKALKLYRLLFPFFWCAVQLDKLLIGARGFMLIARARRRQWLKRPDKPALSNGRSLAEATLGGTIGSAAKLG